MLTRREIKEVNSSRDYVRIIVSTSELCEANRHSYWILTSKSPIYSRVQSILTSAKRILRKLRFIKSLRHVPE